MRPVTANCSQCADTAHVGARTTAADEGVKPSIVLVHGAWGDSANWNGVVSRLQEDGYTVYVPPNPLLGLTYDAAAIRDFLDTISGPIILVGHSYGGAVITNAATGDPNVKALVSVDGFAPAQGQTIGQLVSAVPGPCAGPPNLVPVPTPAPRPAPPTPISARAPSRPAWPTACPLARPRCWGPPSGRCRRSR